MGKDNSVSTAHWIFYDFPAEIDNEGIDSAYESVMLFSVPSALGRNDQFDYA